MNKYRLLNILKQPELLDHDTDMPALKELTEAYPYFPLTYTILAKALHRQRSIYYDKHEKLSAIYTGDRELLFDYINKGAEEREEVPAYEPPIVPQPASTESREPVQVLSIPEAEQVEPGNKFPAEPEVDPPAEVSAIETQTEIKEVAAHQTDEDVQAITAHSISENKPVEKELAVDDSHEQTRAEQLNINNKEVLASEDISAAEPVNELPVDVIEPEEKVILPSNDTGKVTHIEEVKIPTEASSTAENEPVADVKIGSAIEAEENQPIERAALAEIPREIAVPENTQDIKAPDTDNAEPDKEKKTGAPTRFSLDKLELTIPASYDYFASQKPFSRRSLQPRNSIFAGKKEEKPETHQQENALEALKINKKQRFSSWLEVIDTISDAPLDEKENSANESSTAHTSPEKAGPPAKHDPPAAKKPARHEIDSIIDKFIQEDPKIKPVGSRIYSAEEMAKRSAEPDHTMASETLANIYLRQGLTDKAIETFQLLALRFPEKKDNFMAKIDAIKNPKD